MKKVNIILGRFQPITLGHMKMVEELYKINGYPTVFCMVSNKKFDKKHPFSDELINKQFCEIRDEKIAGKVYVKNADIVKFAEELHINNYEPYLWAAGSDRYVAYKKQSDGYKEKANLLSEFDVVEIKRDDEDISATKVRESIANGDLKEFIKMTPKNSDKIFNEFKEAISKI